MPKPGGQRPPVQAVAVRFDVCARPRSQPPAQRKSLFGAPISWWRSADAGALNAPLPAAAAHDAAIHADDNKLEAERIADEVGQNTTYDAHAGVGLAVRVSIDCHGRARRSSVCARC